MKKLSFSVVFFVAVCAVHSASAQTTSTTGALKFNASDWNIPPAVQHYLENHPKVLHWLINYYKQNGHLPDFPKPGADIAATVAADGNNLQVSAAAPVTTATIPVQSVQPAATIAWPKMPAMPAQMPVLSGNR